MEQRAIGTIDEFYRKYLPEDDKKYPINMRVSKEEENLILERRGLHRWRDKEDK